MGKRQQDKSIEMFNKTAEIYYKTYNGRHAQKVIGFVKETLGYLMNERGCLLDVGCGTGRLIRHLSASYPRWSYSGIDLSEKMLEICQRKKGCNQDFILASSENIPFDSESFHIITCTDSFHHYVNPQKALNEMYRVLAKDGYLILCEIWLPIIARQFINVCLKFIHTGDVKIYNKSELKRMIRKAGFRTFKFTVKSPMIYECIVKK